MFLKNLLATKKVVKRRYTYPAFTGMLDGEAAENNTESCFNFVVKDGRLETGFGFGVVVLPTSETSGLFREVFVGEDAKCDLWYYREFDSESGTRKDKLVWSTVDGDLGYFDVVGYSRTYVKIDCGFSELPSGVCYTYNDADFMLFSTDGELRKFQSGQVASLVAVLPKFVDLCYAYDRLWGIVEGRRNKIIYSPNLDPCGWGVTESFVTLDDEQGECNKLILLEDDLFVFRDRGITRVREYGADGSFEMFSVFNHSSIIYGKTAVRCGEKILFLAKNGLYSFNGSSVKKLLPILDGFLDGLDNKNAVACFDGKYYLIGLKMNFFDGECVGCEEGEFTNNALIAFNVFDGTAQVARGVDIRSIVKVANGVVDKVFATFYGDNAGKIGQLDQSGEVFGQSLLALWREKQRNFGTPEKNKNIRQVFVKSAYEAEMFVKTDKKRRGAKIKADSMVQGKKFNVCGREECVEFRAVGPAKICPPKILFEEEV